MEFLNALIKYDKQLLLFLHSKGNTTWDSFWIFITDPIHWTPLFLVLFLVSYKAFGVKKSVLISLFIALGTINSLLIVTIIKNYIKRLRPINDNSINNCIRVLIETRDYSFVSGHSTVSFTIAFLFYFIFNKTHKFSFIIFLFPLLFAYSRIYLAVHFPLDILFRMLLGYIVAFLIFKLINFVVLKK